MMSDTDKDFRPFIEESIELIKFKIDYNEKKEGGFKFSGMENMLECLQIIANDKLEPKDDLLAEINQLQIEFQKEKK